MRSTLDHVIILLVGMAIVYIALTAYWRVVRAHLYGAFDDLNKGVLLDGQRGLAWLNTKLLGWKTILLAWIAALVQAGSALLTSDLSPFKDLPWSMVFEEKVANWVTFGIAALIPITHAMGMAKAAATPPADD